MNRQAMGTVLVFGYETYGAFVRVPIDGEDSKARERKQEG